MVWTPILVLDRLEDAYRVLRDLPGGHKKAIRTVWPETKQPTLIELIETQEIVMRDVRVRPRPTARRISQMEQAIAWPELIGDPEIANVLRLKCMWEVNGGVWARRLERRKIDPDWFVRAWQRGFSIVAAELNRQAVPVG